MLACVSCSNYYKSRELLNTDLADAKNGGGRAEEFVAKDNCDMWFEHLDRYRDARFEKLPFNNLESEIGFL